MVANTGRLLIGLGESNEGCFTYIDMAKSLSQWRSTSANWPSHFDADNYPQGATGIDHIGSIALPLNGYTGSYWLEWSGSVGSSGSCLSVNGSFGTHTVHEDLNSNVDSQSSSGIFLKGSNGRVRFTPTTGSVNVNITTKGSSGNFNGSGFSGLKLYRADQKTLLDAGEIFNPDYLSVLQNLNPRIIRTGLSWDNLNGNIISRFSYERPVSAITYQSDFYIPEIWAGEASWNSGTDTYTVSEPAGWEGFVDGAMLQFWIPTGSANNSTSTKLVIGSSDPKDIYSAIYAAPIVGNFPAGALTVVYIESLGKFVIRGEGGVNGGIPPMAPVEIHCAIANKLGKDLWINIPHLYNNADAQSRIELIRDNLDESLTCYLEFSNEIGTQGAAFTQTRHAWNQATTRLFPGGTTDPHTWYGMRAKEIYEIADSVWTSSGRSRSTLKTVGGGLIFQTVAGLRDLRYNGRHITADANGDFTTGTTNVTATGGTGGVSSTGLTVTGTPSGTIRIGHKLNGIAITSYGTGTGGAGTYGMASAQTIANGSALTFTPGGSGLAIATNYASELGGTPPIDYMDVLTVANYWCGAIVQNDNSRWLGLESTTRTISGISKANPAEVTTSASHGWSTGNRIYLNPVSGMTELNNCWATITSTGAATFTLSDIVNSSGNPVSNDSTGYGTFTSGTVSRISPGILDDMVSAIDDFMSGVSSRIEDALDWIDTDMRSGVRPAGLSAGGGEDGTLAKIIEGPSSIMYFNQYKAGLMDVFNKPCVLYEGGWDAYPLTATYCAYHGIDADYATNLRALMTAYKENYRAQMFIQDLLEAFVDAGATYPAMLGDVTSAANRWELIYGDIYSEPWQFFDGAALFSSNRKRFRAT